MASILPKKTPEQEIDELKASVEYWRGRWKDADERGDTYYARSIKETERCRRIITITSIAAVWVFIICAILSLIAFGTVALYTLGAIAAVAVSGVVTIGVYRDFTR